MTTELVRYDAMCRAIDLAYEVDEVKDIRDKAAALQHYARQANNVEAEQRACQIRLRAERKAGQLLKDREPPRGNRYRGSFLSTLKDHGITKQQIRRAEREENGP